MTPQQDIMASAEAQIRDGKEAARRAASAYGTMLGADGRTVEASMGKDFRDGRVENTLVLHRAAVQHLVELQGILVAYSVVCLGGGGDEPEIARWRATLTESADGLWLLLGIMGAMDVDAKVNP